MSAPDAIRRKQRLEATVRVLRRAGLAAAAYAAVTAVALLVLYVRLRAADPLNNAALLDLREQFAKQGAEPALVETLRAQDLAARRGFFYAQARLARGGQVLAGGMALCLVLLQAAAVLDRRIARPAFAPASDRLWPAAGRARWWVACLGLALAALAVILGLSVRLEVEPAGVKTEAAE